MNKEKKYFIENLAVLLSSGMPIIPALEALRSDLRSRRFARMIANIKEDVEAGLSLSDALTESGLFASHIISLIKIGERSGRLTENLRVVALAEQKARIFRSKIRAAMIYPALVLGIVVVVGLGTAWFVLPRLTIVFRELKITLPLLTRLLLATGDFIGSYGILVIPAFLLLCGVGVYFAFFFSKTKFVGQSFLFAIPGIKKLIREVEVSRFGFLLGTLLEAGLPIGEALRSLAYAATFYRYQRFYLFLVQSIEEGNSFGKSFSAYPGLSALIPTMVVELVSVGEQSGHLADTLKNVGAQFEERTENTTKNLAVVLEPVLLIVVWFGVMGVALAIILPIYSLIGGLDQTSRPSFSSPIAALHAFFPREYSDAERIT